MLQGLLANCLKLVNKYAQQGLDRHAGSSTMPQLREKDHLQMVKQCTQATLGPREGYTELPDANVSASGMPCQRLESCAHTFRHHRQGCEVPPTGCWLLWELPA